MNVRIDLKSIAATLAIVLSGCGSRSALNGGGAMLASVGPGGTAARAVQEADIYKLVGNDLYILNADAGLQIVDVTNLQSPAIVGRVPVQGSPREIYVEGSTAYVLVSGAFDYDCGGYQGVCGWQATSGITTQILSVDVTQPAAPNILADQVIQGDLQDLRIVGNILYVISDTDSQTAVVSFDVSNPKSFKKVDEQDFQFGQWDDGIFLNVTDTRITLAEAGDTCDQDTADGRDSSGCSEDVSVTQFVPIDITDPAGKLVLGTAFVASGIVQDRWAMDFDPTSGILRAVLSNDSPHVSPGGGSLLTWSAPTVNQATQLGSLTFQLGDHITAATFDGPRLYVSTSSATTNCPDPVAIFDTTNAAQPQQLGSVAVTGAIDFLYPHGNQLVSLGHADATCTAFKGSGQLAVGLFDVTNAASPSLLSQVSFGQPTSIVGASSADMEKAFLVLDSLGLILVPFQNPGSPSSQAQGGTQLIDFAATGLTLRGMAPHPGLEERAFPVQNDLVAFSNQTLQVIDISNQDQPATVTQLGL